MSRWIVLVGVALTLTLLGGCDRGSPPALTGKVYPKPEIPQADEVVRARIIPQVSLPPGTWPTEPLTQPGPLGEVIAWLRGIDWSQQPRDMTRIDLPPVSQLRVELRSGDALELGILDGGIIYREGLWPAEGERLKAIFRKGE